MDMNYLQRKVPAVVQQCSATYPSTEYDSNNGYQKASFSHTLNLIMNTDCGYLHVLI